MATKESGQEMLKKHVKQAVNIGLGLAELAGSKLEEGLKKLEQEGYINRNEGQRLSRELLREANALQKKFSSRVDKEVQRVVNSSRVATKSKTKSGGKKRRS